MAKGVYQHFKDNYLRVAKNTLFYMVPFFSIGWNIPKLFEMYNLGTYAAAQQAQLAYASMVTTPFAVLSKPKEAIEKKENNVNKDQSARPEYNLRQQPSAGAY